MRLMLASLLAAVSAGFPALGAADEETVETLPLGSPAPDFSLPGVDGKTYSLASFAGAKVLMVVFTCNHCPTAQNYEERLKRIATEYAPRGVAVVAISPNDPRSVRLDELGYTDLSDTFEEMKVRARERQFNFPYLYDGDAQKTSRAYGPVATPHVFLFDRERRLRYVGRVDDSERPGLVTTHDARDALEALLAGREVANPKSKSFGCSIKWAGKQDEVKRYMERLAALPVTVELADATALAAVRKNEGGKLRLINVWATWCGPCITEFPELVTLHRMYGHRAFEVVTVAANYPDEKPEVLAFLQKQQAAMRNVLFASTDKYALAAALDPDWSAVLPFTLLIGPAGEVLYRREGAFDPLAIKRLIVRTLKEDRFKDGR